MARKGSPDRVINGGRARGKVHAIWTLVVWLGTAAGAVGQTFNSGSDGSYGPINCASGRCVLDVPADGIFKATTVSVAQGVTLAFNPNPLNTPVYILATGNIVVAGTIDVSGGTGGFTSGRGGPGGFDGGGPGLAGIAAGDGRGPGGGKGGVDKCRKTSEGVGSGSFGTSPPATDVVSGAPYGAPVLIPLVGGSGGGGSAESGDGGGGGGGAILLASNTRVQIDATGVISASGALNGAPSVFCGQCFHAGSGGAIRIVAPIVLGSGALDVSGPTVCFCCFGCSCLSSDNQGRMRIDATEMSAMAFQFRPDTRTTSLGRLMVVFPAMLPKLSIVEVAGQTIPEGQPMPMFIQLPFGSAMSQSVKLRLRDAVGINPAEVAVTPDNGAGAVYQTQIDMTSGNPAEATVTVQIPVNTPTQVSAWVR